jgi:hypothetical protein
MLNTQSLQLALSKGVGSLPESTAENLSDFINSGEYDAATRLANAAFLEGCSDVRCIVALLLGTFIERGPESIPEIFSTVGYLLDDSWNVIEPKSRQPAVTDGALTQLFRSLKTLIDFHESVRDHVWQQWTKSIDKGLRIDGEQAARKLACVMSRLGEHNRTATALAALQAKIAAAFEFAQTPESPASLPPALTSAHNVEPIGAQGGEEEVREANAQEDVSTYGEGTHRLLLPSRVEVSPELARLMDQLDAFSVLIERGELTRAAIVAYDVRKTIESFDPVRFLPSLFAAHFQLLGSKIHEISAVWEQEGSPQWHVLVQHYRADLEGFVRG